MTTQHITPENNDNQTTVAEESSALHSPSLPGETEVPVAAQAEDTQEAPASEFTTTGSEVEENAVRPFTDFIEEFQQTEQRPASLTEESQDTDFRLSTSPSEVLDSASTIEEHLASGESLSETASENESSTLAGAAEPVAEVPETVEAAVPVESAPVETVMAAEEPATTETAQSEPVVAQEAVEAPQSEPVAGQETEARQGEPVSTEEAPKAAQSEPAAPAPAPQAERPVSPLLRPSTRVRVPRHMRHREERAQAKRDEAAAAAAPVEKSEQPISPPLVEEAQAPVAQTSQPVEAAPAPTTTDTFSTQTPQAGAETTPAPTVEEQPKPPRRYRFDRPAASTANTLSATGSTTSPASASATPVVSTSQAPAFNAARAESAPVVEREVAPSPAKSPTTLQETFRQSAQPAAEPESVKTSGEQRKHNSFEREKEQPTAVAPAVEEIAASKQPEETTQTEPAVEDLPPLEYSELQAASSRRRRRRRSTNGTTPAANGNGTPTQKPAQPEQPTVTTSPATPKNSTPAANAGHYALLSGTTVNQLNHGNEAGGPFMGPEPSPARGSVMSTPTPSRTSRAARNEAQRVASPASPVYPTPSRPGELVIPQSAINQLSNAITQAIQTQTDRMVAELRRTSQGPTNVSVSLPPFPSNERVGVFVDVANLLYSARTLRMTIDFGKLLDFLRGNRRLVRAHAYCPTSPQPGEDQMFLQAVKGLGYRITTKNYKTFSSGAKKADLDLDLCMDVVRLVDGKAVDCVVLVSGDSDFMPMLDYCSDHGVRVEVAAFDESMSATLRQSCDLFINLSMLDEIRV